MALLPTRENRPADLLALSSEYNGLLAADSERLSRYKLYREEQMGSRPSSVTASTSQVSDYGRRTTQEASPRHKIQLPLGKAMTVKHAYRIAGQLPDVVVDQRDASKQEQHRSDSMEKIVWAVMRHSKGDTALASAAWDASELGSAVFDMYWDAKAQLPRFRRIDPSGCIAVQGVDDPHDFQRFYRAWDAPLASVAAQYRNGNFRGASVLVDELTPSHRDGGQDIVRIVSCCDKEKVTRFAVGADNGSVVGLYEFTHSYGFTPYGVIPNIGPYEDVWGWADYEFVRSLIEYLPMIYSREADVLKAVANGGMIEKGTGADPSDVRRVAKEGGVLPSKRDGTVEPIQAPDMPGFHKEHMERGIEFLKMLGFTPNAAWGLGGAGSGTDRGLQLQPMLEYTAMKQLNWSAGLTRLFGMSFKMIEQNMTGKNTLRGAKNASGGRKLPFVLQLGPEVEPATTQVTEQTTGMPETVELPRTPKELFDGDYEVRFAWKNHVDPDDPQYVMSEMNKFKQGAQSLETTLENLGFQAPEDEMKRIENEAERFPWINQGMIALLKAQLDQQGGGGQGEGGGPPSDDAGAVAGGMETMMGGGGGAGGALNADAATAASGAPAGGPMYGGA